MERPILFSAPMVKALLEGRKTQTRRIVKPQPPTWASAPQPVIGAWCSMQGVHPVGECEHPKCAHSVPDNSERGRQSMFTLMCPYGKPGDRLWVKETFCAFDIDRVHYRADFAPDKEKPSVWKPSLFMPRWASRLTLEITNVRVQRVEDISEEDAKVEGFVCRGQFLDLFYNVNKRAPAGSNPWVWALTFKVTSHA